MFAFPRGPAYDHVAAAYSSTEWIGDQQWTSDHHAHATVSTYLPLTAAPQEVLSTDYPAYSYFPDRVPEYSTAPSVTSFGGWASHSSYTPNYSHEYAIGSGSESSNVSSPLYSGASASSLPSSPSSGYAPCSDYSASALASPAPLASTSTHASSLTHPQSPCMSPKPRARKSRSDSTMHAFSLSTLEPVDASDDPFPVSLSDLMRSREDVDYGGLSYHFALPNSAAAAAASAASSSGRCTPDSDAADERGSRSSGLAKRKPKVKLHPCDVCGKTFPRPSGLKTHMNSHSGEKPFPCPVPDCKKTFTVRSNAKRHLRTHGIVPEPRAVPGRDGTIDFDTPVIAEDIAEAHIDGRKMRIRWIGSRPDVHDEQLPRSVRGAEKASSRPAPQSAVLTSPTQLSPPPAPAPVSHVSVPSISYALGTPIYGSA